MPKLSIISPVYNVGKYIDKFLNSLTNQTFQDFEIIFVYDNSTDDSYQKISLFCNQETFKNRSLIIHNKEKNGSGFAKDLGFKSTSKDSEFVLFLDSDDYFDMDYFETLIMTAEKTNTDLVCCGYSRINEEDGTLICKEMVNNPSETIYLNDLSFPLFLINTSAWNKLFRKNVVNDCFFGNAKHAEDLVYLLSALKNINTISFVNESKYAYLIHPGSLINTMSYEKYLDTCQHLQVYSSYKNDKQLFNLISAFVFIRIGIGTTIRVCQSKTNEKKYIIKETKNYLKKYFNVFSKNKYLSFHFLKKAKKKGVAIWILKIMYKLNMFGLAVRIYIRRANKSKKEIRW